MTPLARLHRLLFLLAPLAGAATAQDAALRGFDPIALAKGEEQAGKAEFAVQRGPFVYWFANDTNRATFLQKPELHEIQMGGACGRMGPLSGTGNAQRWLVHKERIYIFASDQCREGFRKRGDAFLPVDDAAPADPEALERGKALLLRACTSHGGADRLRTWRSYRHQRAAKNGDTTEQWRTQVLLPTSARFDHDYLQGDKAWRYANVLTPAATFALANDNATALGKDATTELQRDLVHDPLVALRLALDGTATVAAAGKREVAAIAVDELIVWFAGHATTFGIDDDGRVRTARCRGRGPGLWFGAVELVFDDFKESGGLLVPTTVRGTFEGQDAPALSEQREQVEVDGDLQRALFELPK